MGQIYRQVVVNVSVTNPHLPRAPTYLPYSRP